MSLTDHIALAIDFSEPSRAALEGAVQLAKSVGTKKISVLNVSRSVIMPEGGPEAQRVRLEALAKKVRTAAETQLKAWCADLPKVEGVVLEPHVLSGRPAEVIPKAAEDLGATLLAVGTHARKGLRRFFKGSVAEEIVRKATIPTIVLHDGKDGISAAEELSQLHRILVAVDTDEKAPHVLELGLELAAKAPRPREVRLLTVVESPDVPQTDGRDELVEDYAQTIKEIASERLVLLQEEHLADHGNLATTKVVSGEPDEKIVEEVEEFSAQLLVIGSHGKGKASFIEIGSTTALLVRESPISVLVIPSHPDSLKS